MLRSLSAAQTNRPRCYRPSSVHGVGEERLAWQDPNAELGPQLQVQTSSPMSYSHWGTREQHLGISQGKLQSQVVCQFVHSNPPSEQSMHCFLSLQSLSCVCVFVLWTWVLWCREQSSFGFRSQRDLAGQCLSDQRLCLPSVQERL